MESRIDALESERFSYGFLASAFLDLPDQGLVERLRALDNVALGEESPLLAAYLQGIEQKSDQEVLEELGRDRARLMRHVNAQCIKPPYESLYVDEAENEVIHRLNRLFSEAGFAPSGVYKDAPDQLGMELAFMQFCAEQELAALAEEDGARAQAIADVKQRFWEEHPSRWIGRYGEAMAAASETGYYRAIAQMLLTWHE